MSTAGEQTSRTEAAGTGPGDNHPALQEAPSPPSWDIEQAAPTIAAVRRTQPLVHCLSATVSMGIVANGLLAAGGRPMMTETLQEAPAITALADALLINLGTLSTDGAVGIPATVAVDPGRPWVLDPAAVGAAPVRTALARHLLASRPRIVRANASEVRVLAGASTGGRGADSVDAPEAARTAAVEVARCTGGAVAVSGERDLIVDEQRAVVVERGSAMLTRLTGTGCLLGALSAACLAVQPDPLAAAAGASLWLALAGERAAARSRGPGGFATALLDALDEVGRQCEGAETVPAPARSTARRGEPLDLRCYLVTSGSGPRTVEVAAAAAGAGAGVVQVRAKDLEAAALLELVRAVAEAVQRARSATRVLVDDRSDVALAAMQAGAHVHGVHLGAQDLPVRAARQMLGPEAIIGLTTGTLELVEAANEVAGAIDYVGAGPFRPTPTKRSGRRPLGVEGYRPLVAASRVPVVAIGDVRPDDAAALARSGVAGVALVRALMEASDPAVVVARVLEGFRAPGPHPRRPRPR
ncbi:thiamine phosphate synthase [Actinomyces capricornis]|uniref:Multifunctional fusion protein n=1 Tax=Actinomyces capricornis TaxID=2755559 RepID=A0ABN6K2R7_9ACTO|nr:thiamine phosphate synthase [Actinomyces capricornis]BDA63382.1 hypothetical protein MANAM107_02160 [Actinomyces capricornis]